MYKKLCYVLLLYILVLILPSCSTSERLTKSQKKYIPSNSTPIKVLLAEHGFNLSYVVESPLVLCKNEKAIAVVKNRNTLKFSVSGKNLKLKIADSAFEATYFQLKPVEEDNSIFYNGKSYRGILKVVRDGNTVKVINQLPLEDYLKGVVPAEMPTGRDDSYFEALKAFAICARTYALNRLKSNSEVFDIYLDTRDQAYGGAGAEKESASRAVDETDGMILTYDNKPARVYYHSSCGGHTENVKFVFGLKNVPYLEGVEDGDPPNCSMASNFTWEEKYPEDVFIERLKVLTFIGDKKFSLKAVKIKSKDGSDRVSELDITLLTDNDEEKIIKLEGSKIRTVIRTADNNDILRSTVFDISIDENKTVIITGKGYGHGVGLCQWGAIHQSVEGRNYKDILSFYFPGTEVSRLK
ncbi:MAG: SpoIID/LytB domain-containing protein [Ignavibacteriaceae bacterium]